MTVFLCYFGLTNFSDFDSVEWEYWNGEGAVNYTTVAGWDTQTVSYTSRLL